MNADAAVEGALTLSLQQGREGLDGRDDVQSRQHRASGVVFADSRVAKQNQQFVAAGLVNVTVVSPHGTGAAPPETLDGVAPRGVSKLARQPRRSDHVTKHDGHEAEIAADGERIGRVIGFEIRTRGSED